MARKTTIGQRGFTHGSKIVEMMFDSLAECLEDRVTTLHEELMNATPCNTGAAIANWQANEVTPASGIIPHSTVGETAGTNAMPLGSEPRRPGNEAIARRSVNALDFSDPKPTYWLNSNLDYAISLEYGELPTEQTSRTPPAGILQTAINATLRKVK